MAYRFIEKHQRHFGTRWLLKRMALRATGRDILLSACNWGLDNSGPWMRSAGANMYRSTGDIVDNFQSIKDIALSQVDKLCYGAPGCFNDMCTEASAHTAVSPAGADGSLPKKYRAAAY